MYLIIQKKRDVQLSVIRNNSSLHLSLCPRSRLLRVKEQGSSRAEKGLRKVQFAKLRRRQSLPPIVGKICRWGAVINMSAILACVEFRRRFQVGLREIRSRSTPGLRVGSRSSIVGSLTVNIVSLESGENLFCGSSLGSKPVAAHLCAMRGVDAKRTCVHIEF